MDTNNQHKPVLLTLPQAAKEIGVQYRQLLGAAQAGTIPCYRLHNSRILVSVPEVLSAMQLNIKTEKTND